MSDLMQASVLKIDDYICIDDHPCKITAKSESKPIGRRNSWSTRSKRYKIHFTAINIFTGQKREDLVYSNTNMNVPHITKNEYQLVDIKDNTVSYLDDQENLLNDLFLPNLSKSDTELSQEIRDNFDVGKKIYIEAISAMGITAIKGFRITNTD